MRDGPYEVRLIPPGAVPDPLDGNIDVEVVFGDGVHYVATYFTIVNLGSLLRRYQETGECAGGLYVWAKNMVIVRELTLDAIARSVDDLIATGEFEGAFA